MFEFTPCWDEPSEVGKALEEDIKKESKHTVKIGYFMFCSPYYENKSPSKKFTIANNKIDIQIACRLCLGNTYDSIIYLKNELNKITENSGNELNPVIEKLNIVKMDYNEIDEKDGMKYINLIEILSSKFDALTHVLQPCDTIEIKDENGDCLKLVFNMLIIGF